MIIFLLFSIAGVLSIFIFSSSSLLLGIYLTLSVFFIVALIPVILEVRTGEFDFLNPKNLLLLNYSLVLGVYPIYVFTTQETFVPWLQPNDIEIQNLYLQAIATSVIGLVFFYMVYYNKLGKFIARTLPSFSEWSQERTILLAPLMIILGFLSAYIIIRQQGGLQGFFQNLGYWRAVGSVGKGYLTYPARDMLSTIALLFFLSFVNRPENVGKVWTGLFVFVMCLIPSVLLGFRNSVVPPILQIIALWNYIYKPISWKKMFFFGLNLFIFLSLYGIFRHNIEMGRRGLEIFSIQDFGIFALIEPLLTRTPGTEMVVMVMDKMNATHEYQYFGSSIFESMTILFPRGFWPEKPTAMIVFGREIMGDYLIWRDSAIREATGGLSPTLIGYLYWQMGFIGVFLGTFVLGLLAKTAYEYMSVNLKDKGSIFLYTIIMSGFPVFAESPQDAMNSLVIRLTTSIGLLWLLKSRLK